MGRPTKLNAKRTRAACDVVRAGGTWKAAAAAAGVCESVFHDWRERAAAETEGPYHAFGLAIAKAEAEGEAIAVEQVFRSFTECTVETREEQLPDGGTKIVTTTRPPDPAMALRWLERRLPQRWNLPHRLHHAADPDGPPICFYLPDNGRDPPQGGQPDGGGAGSDRAVRTTDS